jgi:hypothetical protein
MVIGLMAAASARAQTPSSSDKALAEALFQDGRALLASGKVPEACAKFAESEQIEPKLGTLLNLATCHERQGKTASAWAEFTQAVARAQHLHQSEREALAREHARDLEKRLSMLDIGLDDAAPGESVKVDGRVLGPGAIGTPFPVDPGEHLVEAFAPEREPWQQRLLVGAGQPRLAVRIPPLSPARRAVDEPHAAPVASSPIVTPPVLVLAPPPLAPQVASAPADMARTDNSRTPRIAGLTSAGIALAAIGVGSYYGIKAFKTNTEAEHECPAGACSSHGMDLYGDVNRSANVSTVSFALGAVAAAAAVYLLTRHEPATSTH